MKKTSEKLKNASFSYMNMKNSIPTSDKQIIVRSKHALEKNSFALVLSKVAEKPVAFITGLLPDKVQENMGEALRLVLCKATEWASKSTGTKENPILRGRLFHRVAMFASGVAGGSGGAFTTTIELPISTGLILRRIACIAEEEGHDVSDPRIRFACVSILSMGGNSRGVKGEEVGYWTVRKAMGKLVTDVIKWGGKGTAPALARFMTSVGSRFGIVLSEKAAIQAAPLIGGLSGGAINTLFSEHYESIARAYFSLERLCLVYGVQAVQEVYAKA